MITVSDIPNAWKDNLSIVQEEFPEAVISGGCLRDLYHGKTYKDVDFFVKPRDNMKSRIDNLRYEEDDVEVIRTFDKEYNGLCDVDYIHTYRSQGVDLEIISSKLPDDQMMFYDRFDFGICLIQFDGKELKMSDAFITDSENKTFTLLRCQDQANFDRSVRRHEKLTAQKYVDWKMIIPPEFKIFQTSFAFDFKL